MRPSERKRQILDLLLQRDELSVDEVCRLFAVSPATARRAFAALAREGSAEKTWGGLRALGRPAKPDGALLPARWRLEENALAKQAIAATAAAKASDREVVFIDGGSTTYRLAPHLANRPVRIVTNSLLVAHEIDRLRRTGEGAEVCLTGGILYPATSLTIGPDAIASVRQRHAQIAFLSAGGVDPQGASNNNRLVVEVERAMLEGADRTFLLVDASKFGSRKMIRECGWEEIHAAITDHRFEDPEGLYPTDKIEIAKANSLVASPNGGLAASRREG